MIRLFHNGRIYPFAHQPAIFHTAMIVEKGRIAALGDVATLATQYPAAIHTDLAGGVVLPSFFDAHIHIWKVGELITHIIDVRGVKSIAALQMRLREYAEQHPEAPWIRARGFNEILMEEQRMLIAADLDAVLPDRPVYVQRTCAHISVVNTRALQVCGLNPATPPPLGGELGLLPNGKLSGVLIETAQGLVTRHFPPYQYEDYERMILAACQKALAVGITAMTDPAVMPDLLAAYIRMDKAGKLPLKINAIPIMIPDGGNEMLPLPERYESDCLTVNTVKFFADGGLSGQTAALTRPYVGTQQRGVLRLTYDRLLAAGRVAQEKGFAIATHAIGDEAIETVVQVYETLYQEATTPIRHRIEHLGLPTPAHLQRIKAIGVFVVTQPIFLEELGANFEQYIDNDYLQQCYPFRGMLDSDVEVAFSTDAPVVRNIHPFVNISCALTRQTANGTVIAPHEAITLAEAFKCYTLTAAAANQWVSKTGSLAVGKDADFIVLPLSPYDVPNVETLRALLPTQVWARGERRI